MKILVLSQYWTPENGVPQRRWSWLSKILIQAGHEVIVISPPPHYQRSITVADWWKQGGLKSRTEVEKGPSGEEIFRSGYFPTGQSLTSRIFNQAAVATSMLTMLRKHSPRIREFAPDLVIGTVPALPTAVVTQIAARRLGTPYIIDLRDAWPDLLQNSADWNASIGKKSIRERILSKGPLQLLIKFTEWSINGSLQNANGIITTSEELATHLERRFNASSGEKCIGAIRNVFPQKTDYVGTAGNKSSGNSLNVLYAGTLGRAQKLENALIAAEIAHRRGFDIKLRLLGDGASWSALERRIEDSSIDVTLQHRIAANALYPFYDWADTALVHLADWEPLTRTIPSKAYELMSVGVHMTAVVEGEAARLVDELDAGVVVDPENPEALAQAWIDLIKDRSKLQVSQAGKQWVEHQRDEVVPNKLIEIVTNVVKTTYSKKQ